MKRKRPIAKQHPRSRTPAQGFYLMLKVIGITAAVIVVGVVGWNLVLDTIDRNHNMAVEKAVTKIANELNGNEKDAWLKEYKCDGPHYKFGNAITSCTYTLTYSGKKSYDEVVIAIKSMDFVNVLKQNKDEREYDSTTELSAEVNIGEDNSRCELSAIMDGERQKSMEFYCYTSARNNYFREY